MAGRGTAAIRFVLGSDHHCSTGGVGMYRDKQTKSVYPRKRTCAVQLGMSALGQKRTSCTKSRGWGYSWSWSAQTHDDVAHNAASLTVRKLLRRGHHAKHIVKKFAGLHCA